LPFPFDIIELLTIGSFLRFQPQSAWMCTVRNKFMKYGAEHSVLTWGPQPHTTWSSCQEPTGGNFLEYSKDWVFFIPYPKCLGPEVFQISDWGRFGNICIILLRYISQEIQVEIN
jgi:hypothetical protein